MNIQKLVDGVTGNYHVSIPVLLMIGLQIGSVYWPTVLTPDKVAATQKILLAYGLLALNHADQNTPANTVGK